MPPRCTARGRPSAEDPGRRTVAVCRVTDTGLVLGSTQSEAVVDRRPGCDAAGISVVRRSSGGGAVLVAPGDPVWVDVWIPVGDPLWHPLTSTGPSTGWARPGWTPWPGSGSPACTTHTEALRGLHPVVVGGVLRRRGGRRGGHRLTGARWSDWPSAGTDGEHGSTVPACSAGIRRPWSELLALDPADRRAAVTDSGPRWRAPPTWPTSSGVPAPDGRAHGRLPHRLAALVGRGPHRGRARSPDVGVPPVPFPSDPRSSLRHPT